MLVVLNSSAFGPRSAPLCGQALVEIQCGAGAHTRLETRGDGHDVARVAEEIRRGGHELVVAGGGDGTVRDVVQAVMDAGAAGAATLAILPLGTANNVARSLGIPSFRQEGDRAVATAVGAIFRGVRRRIDLGLVAERYLAGAMAIGMDADILATRNAIRTRLRLGKSIGGYPLYLYSCAINALRPHARRTRLSVAPGTNPWDGGTPAIYNLVVTNAPLYAGEFRFGANDSLADGYLDLHVFGGAFDYLRRYPAAWRRHVRHARGRLVAPPTGRLRFQNLSVDLDAPAAWQLDGEEMAKERTFRIEVVPQALAVCVPASEKKARIQNPGGVAGIPTPTS